jgi:hypothetical protein
VALVGAVGIELKRDPDLRGRTEFTEIELAEYADDLIWLSAQGDRFADHVRVGAEAAGPQAVADDHDARTERHVLFGHECAAVFDRRAEQPEEIGRDPARLQLFGELAPV